LFLTGAKSVSRRSGLTACSCPAQVRFRGITSKWSHCPIIALF